INTAQRLQAAADPDGILVGDSTRAESGYAIAYAPAEAVDAHGKRRPVQGSRVLGARSPAPQAARPHDLPLVGRRAELDILVEALRRSRAGPQAHLVTVVGAPGIGKTRLIAELAAQAAAAPQPVSWRHGRSLAYGERIAHWALGEIVKEQAGILDSDTAEVVVAKLGG